MYTRTRPWRAREQANSHFQHRTGKSIHRSTASHLTALPSIPVHLPACISAARHTHSPQASATDRARPNAASKRLRSVTTPRVVEMAWLVESSRRVCSPRTVTVLPRHAGGWAQLRAARSRRANGARAVESGQSSPCSSEAPISSFWSSLHGPRRARRGHPEWPKMMGTKTTAGMSLCAASSTTSGDL